MSDERPLTQATAIAALLPALMRQLFAGDDDLAAELPLAQLRVCGVLHEGPRSMSALSRELHVSLSAMTQLANRLERAGLVSRVAEGNDRRVRQLQLTPRGAKLMQLREDTRCQRISAVLRRLAPEARKKVLTALGMLRDASITARIDRAPIADQCAAEVRQHLG